MKKPRQATKAIMRNRSRKKEKKNETEKEEKKGKVIPEREEIMEVLEKKEPRRTRTEYTWWARTTKNTD